MSELEIIRQTGKNPITRESILSDLRALGVAKGTTLVVHSSLRSLGWVSGGAAAVILALEEAVGEEGTLVMPTHSGDYSEPSYWENPPVPDSWQPVIRETMPAFNRELTPTRGMGVIPETFRKQQGVLRSGHPQGSFAARGRRASWVTTGHQLDFAFGESSPLARVYDLEGWILLLGVGQESNTSLHLAEYRAEYAGKEEIIQAAPVIVAGQRQWMEFRELEENSEQFPEIGRAYAEQGGEYQLGKVGNAEAFLFPQTDLVDFAVAWLEDNRKTS